MEKPAAFDTEQILGIQFFNGTPAEAVARISANGGLLVAPSGTCFERFLEDAEYRRAILSADLVLPDSGAMVALWRILRGRKLPRISGLAYLQQLLDAIDLRDVLWVLPHERAQEKLLAWAGRRSEIGDQRSEVGDQRSEVGDQRSEAGVTPSVTCSHGALSPCPGGETPRQSEATTTSAGRNPRSAISSEKPAIRSQQSAVSSQKSAVRNPPFEIDPPACYLAPIYGSTVTDQALAALVAERQPRHIVIAIGAGAQEKLGWYLRENLLDRPAIHCIGGALGFVTGEQVAIPAWADRLYLGWFLRFLSQPRAFLPRLWKARVLPALIARHGSELPPLR